MKDMYTRKQNIVLGAILGAFLAFFLGFSYSLASTVATDTGYYFGNTCRNAAGSYEDCGSAAYMCQRLAVQNAGLVKSVKVQNLSSGTGSGTVNDVFMYLNFDNSNSPIPLLKSANSFTYYQQGAGGNNVDRIYNFNNNNTGSYTGDNIMICTDRSVMGSPTGDSTFTITYSTDPAFVPSTIDIISPQNATTTSDFDNWYTSFSISTTTFSSGFIQINWGNSTTTHTQEDYRDIIIPPYSSASYGINKGQSLSNSSSYGTWYAQAFLYGNNDEGGHTLIASSSMISFSVNSPFVPSDGGFISNMPTSTSFCDNTEGWFAQGFCNVSVYLFTPSQTSINNFSGLYSVLQNKPPFGYFNSAKNAINSLSTSTTSTLSFVDTSSLNTTIFNPLKAIITTILWFLFVFWLFYKIRNIQL